MKLGKYILTIFSALMLYSCATPTESSYATLGKVDVADIEDSNWFIKRYDDYEPSPTHVNSLQNLPANVQILAFAGTWDERSRQSLPEFYKIADEANVADDQVVLYLLDQNMKGPDRDPVKFNVESLPTYIIIKDGKEVSRITGDTDSPIGEELTRTMETYRDDTSI